MGGTFTIKGLLELQNQWPDIAIDTVYELIQDCLFLHRYVESERIELDEIGKRLLKKYGVTGSSEGFV